MRRDDRPTDGAPTAEGAAEAGRAAYDHLRETVLTGVAITVPVVVTAYVLLSAIDFLVSSLEPFVAILGRLGVLRWVHGNELVALLVDAGVYADLVNVLSEIVAAGVLLAVVLAVGSVGRHRYGEHLVGVFDFLVSSVPGVGAVYESFRRMGDVMLGDEGADFQDVKLVECFGDEIYVIGFQTSDSPVAVEEGTGHGSMVAMFLPLAPNPVTGGLLTYVPEGNLVDVDMTIDEAVRSVLTSGVAGGRGPDAGDPFAVDGISELGDVEALVSSDDGDDGNDAESDHEPDA